MENITPTAFAPSPHLILPSFSSSKHTLNTSSQSPVRTPYRNRYRYTLPSAALKSCPPPLISTDSHPPSPHPLSNPSTFHYNVKLKNLSRKRHSLSRCLHLFDQMRRNHVIPDKYTYSSLLTSCIRSNAPHAANKIYHDIRKQGIPLDYHLRSSLLKMAAMSPSPQLDLCLRLFQGTQRPNLVMCNVMMDAYASAGTLDQSMAIFRYMNHAGIYPDSYSVSALIKAYVKANRIDDAVSNLYDMRRAGLEIPSSAIALIINAYGKNAQLEEAIELHDLMVSWGIPPSQVTFNVLIRACAHVGDIKLATTIFDEMQNTGFGPDRYTFHALIQCHLAVGDGHSALHMYKQISDTPFQYNQVSFRLAFLAVAHVCELDSIDTIINDMQQLGVRPREDVLVALITACIRCSDPKKAKNVIKQHYHSVFLRQTKMSSRYQLQRFFQKVRENLHSHHAFESPCLLTETKAFGSVDRIERSILDCLELSKCEPT